MKLISLKAVVELILSNKAKHCSERIDADSVCNFERMKRIEARMDEDDDIGNKISELPSAFEGKTNGEVIQAVFGVMVLTIKDGKVWVERIFFPFDEVWWNAPYQKGGE